MKLARTWLFAAALAMVVAACGGGPGSGEEGASTKPPSATTNQINAMPRDKVQDGGTLTWPIDQMPVNYNFYQIDGTELNEQIIAFALMPSTHLPDAHGSPVWNRDILASEPRVDTDPKQVITFEIHPKATWSDGQAITWEDFYWQWKACNGTDKAYQIATAAGFEDIESVRRGANDKEVVVTFKRKFSEWQNVFSPLYPASMSKNAQTFNTGWKDAPLATAGPFRVGSIDQTSKTVTVVKNEKWWGVPAKLDKMVFRYLVPDAQVDAFANGELDAYDIGPDANKYSRTKTVAGTEIRVGGAPNFRHITFNGTSANLKDQRVRQALAMGINRASIGKALLAPLGVDATPLGNHILMANQAGYKDNSGEIGRYDPERAKAMLDEAGWKLDGTVRKKNGQPLEVSLVIPAGVTTSRQESELIQNMLAQIGVTVKIDTVPNQDLFDKYLTPGQFDLTVFTWGGTPYPISSSKSVYAKPTTNAKGELQIQQNYARIGSDEIDRLFGEALQELDRDKAYDIVNRADALLWQEVHSLPTYQRPELVACKKNLANFGAFGLQWPWNYEDIGWAK